MPNCPQCKSSFEVTAKDRRFYDRIGVPEPTLCPDCRQQRRMAFRNEKNLYHRKCDLTGKQLVSIYSADKPYTVYDRQEWWGDKWDPLSFGRDFDFSKPFFSQIGDLMRAVPRPAAYIVNGVNSEYNNHVENVKNCYLCVDTVGEDIYYSDWCLDGRLVVDSFYMYKCELCYELQMCKNCYHCIYCLLADDCSDSYFLYDCKNCRDCLMCSNLRNKQYCILNKQYSKEEYFKKLEATRLSDFTAFNKTKNYFFNEFIKNLLHRYALVVNSENCTGDLIFDSRNIEYGFNVTNSEDCKYCQDVYEAKDCYDTYQSAFGCELLYEQHACNRNVNCIACSISYYNSDCRYCDIIYHCHDCFGCVGLRNKRYCILNKQYSKEEYEKLLPKIIEHMRATKEWGEFFPVTLSPFAYNESVAQRYFPLTKDEVLARFWAWHEDMEAKSYKGPLYSIPDDIHDVGDEITKSVLTCEATGKPYKIIPQELKFYREMNLPVPRRCPDQRHSDRMSLRNPRKLWSRTCGKCGVTIQSSYAPNRSEAVYCEKCYLTAVY
ncbi:MAG: zinc-ribbon domain containing protein [Candidatus Peregrinibacteria bacterium]